MSYVFKYLTAERPGLPPAKGPYLPITLHGKDGAVFNTNALIDSGADTCAMPKNIAEIYLGFDLSSAEEGDIASASGPVKARRIDVKITMNFIREKKTLSVPFNVIMSDFEPPVILGRAGFFENFYVSFNEKEKKFSLKPI